MSYAKTKDGLCFEYPYGFAQLQADNPYTNFGNNQDVAYWFPQTNQHLIDGYDLSDVISTPAPSYNYVTQYVVEGQPEYRDGSWYQTWIVETYTPEQQIVQDNKLKQENKEKADAILSDTDWTSIPSVADPAQSNPFLANQAEFLQYRNQVRQIAINPPVVVEVWPTEPDEIWENVPTA